MLKPILASTTGQILSALLAISTYSINKVMQKNSSLKIPVDFYFMISAAYLVILIGSVLYMLIFGVEKKRRNVPFWLFPITGLFDFLAGTSIAWGISKIPIYLAILLLQMIYPMTVLTEFILFKKKKGILKNLGIFFLLVSISYYANYTSANINTTPSSETNPTIMKFLKKYSEGIAFILLTNALFLTNTIIQGRLILPFIDPSPFLIWFSLYGLLIGFIFTIARNHNNFGWDNIKSVYTGNYIDIVCYGLVIGVFYIAASPYIKSFGPNSFNGSVITQSAHFGLGNIILESFFTDGFKMTIKLWGCIAAFVLCIFSSIILVGFETRDKKGESVMQEEEIKV